MADAYDVFEEGPRDEDSKGDSPWQRSEEETAEDLNGDRQIGSGAFDKYPGDVECDDELIEVKNTRTQGLYLSRHQVEKICNEARDLGKRPRIVIEFEDFDETDDKWIAMPFSDYQIIQEELQ